jgi:hypothetical protein
MCARRARARCDRARRQPPRRERCVSDRVLPGDQRQVTQSCTTGHPRRAHRVRNSLGRGVDLVAQGALGFCESASRRATVGRTPTATSRTASSPALASRFPTIVARTPLRAVRRRSRRFRESWNVCVLGVQHPSRPRRAARESSGGRQLALRTQPVSELIAVTLLEVDEVSALGDFAVTGSGWVGLGWGTVGSRLTVPVNRWATSSGLALCRTHARLVFDAGARTPARVGSHDEELRRRPTLGLRAPSTPARFEGDSALLLILIRRPERNPISPRHISAAPS